MPYEFKMTRIVEFAETDMAGIMHFSNYYRYMEATEHAFFRSLGVSVHANTGGAMQGWASVHAECDYMRPLRYPDAFHVHMVVREKSQTSLSYEFLFRRDDTDIARGRLKVVCVRQGSNSDSIRSTPIPPDIDDLIDVAPPETTAP